jgi:hypothetical protein
VQELTSDRKRILRAVSGTFAAPNSATHSSRPCSGRRGTSAGRIYPSQRSLWSRPEGTR